MFARVRELAANAGFAIARAATGKDFTILKQGYEYDTGVPSNYPINWWQKNMPIGGNEFTRFGPVYACISIISQDLSRLDITHFKIGSEGARTAVTNRAPARIFHKPNSYQTFVDFMLFMARALLTDGNAYAVAKRNDRNEVIALYPINPRMVSVFLEPLSGEYAYRIATDPTTQLADLNPDEYFSPRDIFHIRLFTPVHPLVGETPLVAAASPTMAGTEINRHNAAFFGNMSRPSGILRHPGKLEPEAMLRLKKRWMELTQGPNTGEPAILQENMEWQPLTMNAVDAELIKSYELTNTQIMQIFRVPEFLAGGDLSNATMTNVESLTRFWINSSLGWYVTHFEKAFNRFFGLGMNEKIEFNLENALLRSEMKQRIESLTRGVLGGVYTPNEARYSEKLPPVEHGDELLVQQQMVPLGWHEDNPQGINLVQPSSTEDEQDADSENEQSAGPEKRRVEAIDYVRRTLTRAA